MGQPYSGMWGIFHPQVSGGVKFLESKRQVERLLCEYVVKAPKPSTNERTRLLWQRTAWPKMLAASSLRPSYSWDLRLLILSAFFGHAMLFGSVILLQEATRPLLPGNSFPGVLVLAYCQFAFTRTQQQQKYEDHEWGSLNPGAIISRPWRELGYLGFETLPHVTIRHLTQGMNSAEESCIDK